MTGRGIDQILPDSVDPQLYESYVKDARVYVRLFNAYLMYGIFVEHSSSVPSKTA